MNLQILEQAASFIQNSGHTVVFSGAGISVESGIPPFRGAEGLWSKYDPGLFDINFFKINPEKSWKILIEIFYDFLKKTKPNQAHCSIANLQQKNMIQTVITQNIDGLHQKAGSFNVLEFHGSIQKLRCLDCFSIYDASSIIFDPVPPLCPECKGLLKPDIVFFGEPIPQQVQEKSFSEAEKSDVLIIVGTTGKVYPAAHIPHIAKANGSVIIEINVEESAYSCITDFYLQGKAAQLIPKLAEIII